MRRRLNIVLSIAGGPTGVWIVGSSIVKKAFLAARSRPEGSQLGLDKRNGYIWWQGTGGMRLYHMIPKIKHLMKFEDNPAFFIFHCCGNDIGAIPSKKLMPLIASTLNSLSSLFPSTQLVWSQILPRAEWRTDSSGTSSKVLNRARQRINSFAAKTTLKLGGRYIRYPDIVFNNDIVRTDLNGHENITGKSPIFDIDGTHLTVLGNDILLNTIQGALSTFLTSSTPVYPPTW